MASLIPSSLLKRAGDVRFKTAHEVAKGVPGFRVELARRLGEIAHDVVHVSSLPRAPKLLLSNAKNLGVLPPLGASALVTSPPYVNGTNYFRNTKVELWFGRYLRRKEHLSAFRSEALTAGINNVRTKEALPAPHPSVAAVVDQIAEDAYDRRIPLLIASYFAELAAVFEAAHHHLAPGAAVAIDIGDSMYGGVHVPADALAVDCLEQVGYRLTADVHLRDRRSKDGSPLKQTLLVFEREGETRSLPAPSTVETSDEPVWVSRWTSFKTDLPFQQPPYSARNWGHRAHSLCSYVGKLKPAIAHHLVGTFVPEGGDRPRPLWRRRHHPVRGRPSRCSRILVRPERGGSLHRTR